MPNYKKTLRGKEFAIQIDGSIAAMAESCTLTIETPLRDINALGSGSDWVYRIAEKTKSWSGDFSGLLTTYDYDETGEINSEAMIQKAIIENKDVSVAFKPVDISGNMYFYGDAFLNNTELSAEGGGDAGYSFSFTGNGPLNTGTVS